MNNLRDFHDSFISHKDRVLMVLGSKDEVDFDVLKQYGKIKYLTLKDVFGY